MGRLFSVHNDAVLILPLDNCASMKTDATSCSEFKHIVLGAHTVETGSNDVWVRH